MLVQIKDQVSGWISGLTGLDPSEVRGSLEKSKSLDHGHLAYPTFALAKSQKKAPPLIAKELAEKLTAQNHPELLKVDAVGGFLNLHFKTNYLQKILMLDLSQGGDRIGHSRRGNGQRIIIDFCSPNVAKPLGIGHLRATMIGQAISNLAKTQGFDVTGLNHLGDWGVQFGKLAWAFEKWGSEYPFEEKPFDSLYKLYVRFHEEAEKNPELDAEGSRLFLKLEAGDPQIVGLWKSFVEISMKEHQRLLDMLGVKHEIVRGESFYNDRLKATEKLLEDKGLLEESEGAMVVRLDEENLPPCLIRKRDGASLYATRDLASAIYRMEELGYNENLYVVGMDQTLHFRQVFLVLKKLGFKWADHCTHVSFGMYKFKDLGKMSSRKGNLIIMEDVLFRAIAMVEELIAQKNPDLPNRKKVAEQVGVGAIVFNDLMNDRVKNVDFDWDRVLDFEGDSGPYVQYCAVRCKSLVKKYGKPILPTMEVDLESSEERELVKVLLSYQDTLTAAYDNFKPHILAGYLLDVCRAFSQFYHKHRILGEESPAQASRMSLVWATQTIVESGLKVLNVQTPEAM